MDVVLRAAIVLTPVFGSEYFPIRFPEVDELLEASSSLGVFFETRISLQL
jgi:hypothetical protein